MSGTLAFVAATQTEDASLNSLALVVSRAYVHRINRMVANKETVLKWLSPQGSVQKEQTETPIFQHSPKRSIHAYFKSFCLRAWLPIRRHLGAD